MIISNANKIYIGNQAASKIYVGSNLIFSSTWSPDQLGSSLAIWLDSSDINTITLNGSSVSRWNDKSTYMRHAIQETAANQPVYGATLLNNKPGVQFDGINDIMLSPPFPRTTQTSFESSIGSEEFTLFLVAVYPTKNGRFLALREPPTISGTARLYFIKNTTNSWQVSAGDPMVTGPGMLLTQNTGQLLVVAKESGGIIRPYINTVSQTTITPLFPTPYGELRLGGLTATDCSDITINEICIFAGTMSISDRNKMEGYLAWKWGLVDKLPTNHPYKSTQPNI